jgi:hypothetical protein
MNGVFPPSDLGPENARGPVPFHHDWFAFVNIFILRAHPSPAI